MTVEHVAGIAVRNPAMVAFGRHYAVTVATCEPADPASKGGSESTVKIAKADLVPKDTNLRAQYSSFAELEAACEAFCHDVNVRVHRVARRVPAEMLAHERARLHVQPADPHTVAFGVTRQVPGNTPMVAFEGGQYSVPHTLLGEAVWVRVHGRGHDERVVTLMAPARRSSARSVSRCLRSRSVRCGLGYRPGRRRGWRGRVSGRCARGPRRQRGRWNAAAQSLLRRHVVLGGEVADRRWMTMFGSGALRIPPKGSGGQPLQEV